MPARAGTSLGAALLLALAGCLPPAPAPREEAERAIRGLEPLYTQAALLQGGASSIRGRLSGACDGVVRLEVGTANQARPLAAIAAPIGPYVLYAPEGVPVRLRWGCDGDGDGTVASDAVAEATIGQVSRDVPLDLRVPDAALAGRFELVREGTRRGAPAPGPGGAIVPTAGMAPPDAPAPADAAVGPPLPEGPPPDAGPPPPAGSTPPPQ